MKRTTLWFTIAIAVSALGANSQETGSTSSYNLDVKPAYESIEDITGFHSLLGKEDFRPSGPTKTLTLKETINLAMKKNPSIRISKLGLDQSLANLALTESTYKNTYRLDAQANENLRRLVGGKFRVDPEKGLVRESFEHYENSETFTLSPVYQRTFKDASRLTVSPQYRFQSDSDAAFDASSTNPAGKNYDNMYNVDITYDYYLNSKPRQEIRQRLENAKLSTIQADYDIFQTQKQTENAIIGQYWRIKQFEEEVDIQNERLLQAKRIEFIFQTQYEFENASEMEVGQAQIDVQNNEAQLIDLEGNLRSAVETLNYILGIPLETNLDLTDTLQVTPLPLNANHYVDEVTSTNLQLKNMRLAIQKTQNSLRVARLGQQPDVLLSGSYFRNDEGQENLGAALIFSWPFGDGGATKARVQSLRKQLEQQEINLWNTERSLIREAYDDLRNLQLLAKQIEIQKQNVDKAYINLENALFNFQEFGRISFRDMQDFQMDLSRSRSQLASAKVSYNLAKSNLLSKVHYYEPSVEVEDYFSLVKE